MPKGIFARRVREVIIPIGPSIAYVPLTQGQLALIDRDDAAEIGKRNWFARWDPGMRSFYAVNNLSTSTRRRLVGIHRLLMGDPDDLQVDHVSGATLDNRRSNLRIATAQQNKCNARKYSNNTSGYKGVCLIRDSGKFKSSIQRNGKMLHLGFFATPEAAHAAYCEAAHRLHGKFARTA